MPSCVICRNYVSCFLFCLLKNTQRPEIHALNTYIRPKVMLIYIYEEEIAYNLQHACCYVAVYVEDLD